ncbi:MAG: hypothetical protein K1X29_07140 [Bdellovibrionales bacterium]|nr:hypothetical protein [Bdellovibrionales bacterium]
MKMNTLLATAFVSSFLVAPAHSFACGDAAEWANPNAATPAISLENFITYAPLAHDVIISQSHFQARCGDDINFDVVDALSSKTLGRIPVSQNAVKADDGRVLSVRLTQLLKTSRMQLVNVENAIRIFHDDVDALTEDLGIGASFSYALPNRTKNQDRVFLVDVNIKTYCWEDRQRSPYTVHQNLPIKTLRGRVPKMVENKKGVLQDGLI